MATPIPGAGPGNKIDAEVQFRATGLQKLKADVLGLAGDLADPLLVIAQGGTAAAAAWAGFKGVMISRVLGPMALVAGATTGLIASLKITIDQFSKMGLAGAGALEKLEKQFQPLLKSAALAKQRVRELAVFAAVTPFRMDEVARASKMLEVLTKGALSTFKGLRLVGDAAAVADQDFTSVARSVGRLYDGLQSGRPIGEAAFRLQELGLLSGETVTKLERMRDAGATANEMWRVVENDLRRASGAMVELSQSLEGLQSTYEDSRNLMAAGFGKGFMKGEKAGLEATITVMDKLTPVAVYFGEIFGRIYNFFNESAAGILKYVAGIKGLETVLKAAGMAGLAVLGAMAASAGAAIAAFAVQVLAASGLLNVLAARMGIVTTVSLAQVAASKTLAGAWASLRLAGAAVAAGNLIQAQTHLVNAAAATRGAFATNAAAAAQVTLGAALRGVTGLLVLASRAALGMLAAMVASPLFWVAAALSAIGAASLHVYNAHKKHVEMLKELKDATQDANAAFQRQFQLISTIADKTAAYTQALQRLAKAEQELEAGKAVGEDGKTLALREREVASARQNVQRVAAIKDASLARSEDENDAAMALRRSERGAGFYVNADQLRKELAARQATDDATAGGARRIGDLELQRGKAGEMIRMLESGRAGVKSADAAAALDKLLQPYRQEYEALTGQIEGIRNNSGLASDSELRREQAKLRQMESASEAQTQASDAEDMLARIQRTNAGNLAGLVSEGMDPALRAALEKGDKSGAVRAASGLSGLARAQADALAAGAASPRELQEQQNRVTEIREKFDPQRAAEVTQAQKAAGWDERRAGLEEKIAGLKDDGLASAMREFDLKQEQINLERRILSERTDLLDSEKQVEEAKLAAQEKALQTARANMEEQSKRNREGAVLDLQAARAEREAEDARKRGDVAGTQKAEQEAEAAQERRKRMELEEEAKSLYKDQADREKFVNERMGEFRKQRDQEKAEAEKDRQNRRDDAARQGEAGQLQFQAAILRRQGKTKEANALDEQAARKLDESKRRDLEEQYKQDGMSAEDARNAANRQIKIDQANRALDRMESTRGVVVASSMASVGGGGGVYGLDPSLAKLDTANGFLKQIADNTSAELDMNAEDE